MEINAIADGTLEFIGESIFEYLNGKINPTVKASGIIFEPRRVISLIENTEEYTYTAGLLCGNKILINQNAVHDILNKRYIMKTKEGLEFNDLLIEDIQWVKSWFFEVIAHELSHMNQLMDSLRYSYDAAYRMQIEVSNTKRTFKWLQDHLNEIEDIFGKIDFEPIFDNNSYTQSKEYDTYTIDDYVLASGELYKFFDILSACTFSDSLSLFEEAMHCGIDRFGIADYAHSDDYITSFGYIKDIVCSDEILHIVSTYITDIIMVSYKSISLFWTVAADEKELVLAYHKIKDVSPFNMPTFLRGVYKNSFDEELAFCDKYFDKKHFKYIGEMRSVD